MAVALGNSPEYVLLTFALARLGAVKVAINAKLAAPGMRQILEHSHTKYLFIESGSVLLPELLGRFDSFSLDGYCIIGDDDDAPLPRSATWKDLDARLEKVEKAAMDRHPAPDDVADIIYTSGSTSTPKGVLLSHDMLLRSAYANCLNRGFETGRRVYVPLPLYHVYGYVEGLLSCLFVGGAVLLAKGKFDARSSLLLMSQERANDILSMPSIMMALIREQENRPVDLSALHAAYCSAAACPAWLWRGMRTWLGLSDSITGYGMIEMSGASMQTVCGDSDEILTGKVGRLLPGGCSGVPAWGGNQMQVRVVDAGTGSDVPPGACGELWCRGSTVTAGYYNNRPANKEAFTHDGWFKTGDIGSFDAQGYLTLHGRCNDTYRMNGENISPRFVEAEIIKCQDVKYVKVLGIPYPKYGEVGIAFVELWDDAAADKQGVIEYCRSNLGAFQVPFRFFFIAENEWPTNSTGKIQKQRLAQMASERLASEGHS